jgi:hypothetical protein
MINVSLPILMLILHFLILPFFSTKKMFFLKMNNENYEKKLYYLTETWYLKWSASSYKRCLYQNILSDLVLTFCLLTYFHLIRKKKIHCFCNFGFNISLKRFVSCWSLLFLNHFKTQENLSQIHQTASKIQKTYFSMLLYRQQA